MMMYFLLIGFAVLFVGGEFIAETYGNEFREAFLAQAPAPATTPADQEAVLQPLNHLRNKAVLVIAIIMVVILIVMTMFMKQITEPLQHMISASRKISGGDLSQTIRIDSNNELAELGGVINEMSSNLQEIIHMSQSTCASGEAFLSSMADVLDCPDAATGDLPRLRQEMTYFQSQLGMLGEAMDCFNFYAIPESDV